MKGDEIRILKAACVVRVGRRGERDRVPALDVDEHALTRHQLVPSHDPTDDIYS